ncbi:hypothetical protein SERLA73DRAFT_119233 [Serpula lacrymans var. lacrymans S7.3]|uniref:Uncharacterized protein n=2 Tax=Serpula lacrymans var. lacrymans TaxID=341189 RepID=F8PK81_SERL3|nr:uncharacterized protein SERLADRAFT_365368 [Serpula lacrymans var. lacrymans S7.9]EGO03535.1 hypothetical protein SERLA73DRAFT_119233 [Serpula lacrymans var. lacrymans S7.3]EGO29347.1 hypothetical protein SERLADRAFT_365368 [Serpula lacrymans var. lacrymans S7.9]
MEPSEPLKPSTTSKKCRIAEMIQYTCELEETDGGMRPHCYPLLRIFRMCPDRPACEITKFTNINTNTGEVEIPGETSELLPKAKPWRDVYRYQDPLDKST